MGHINDDETPHALFFFSSPERIETLVERALCNQIGEDRRTMLPLFASEWCTKASRVSRARKEWSHPDWEDVPEGHATRDVLMAFAMGSHGRVGAASPIRSLDENLMYQIVTCYLRVPIVVPDDCRFLPPPTPPTPRPGGAGTPHLLPLAT
jgi:hypothetical protein